MFGFRRTQKKRVTTQSLLTHAETKKSEFPTLQLRPNGHVFPFGDVDLWPNLTPKKVRAEYEGKIIVESENTILLHESGYTPIYYFPFKDVNFELLTALPQERSHCIRKGTAHYFTFRKGPFSGSKVAWTYPSPIPQAQILKDHLAFYWDRIHQWFEDDTPVVGSPPDPFVRIETKNSPAPLRVVHAGQLLAETTRAKVLYETGLMPRYFIPEEDILSPLLPSETVTHCTYKGRAAYAHFSIDGTLIEDAAFSYPDPLHDSAPVQGYWSLYFEKLDATILGDRKLLAPLREENSKPVLQRADLMKNP